MAADLSTTPSPAAPAGTLFIMGGAIHADNTLLWQSLVQLTGKASPTFAIIAAAAGNPTDAANRTSDVLQRYGARGNLVPVAPLLAGRDVRADADDQRNATMVRHADAVFFTGGEQSRIVNALVRPDGTRSAVLQAIWDVYQRGGVVAGTSAGAAIMSRTMFHEPDDVLTTIQRPLRQGKEITAGLGFLPGGVFVDQHLLARGRFARMLPAMRAADAMLGIGVDENSAAIWRSDRSVSVVGDGVLIIDMRAAQWDATSKPWAIRNARLSLLASGDRLNTRTMQVTPSDGKLSGTVLSPGTAGYKPYFNERRWYADILGKHLLVDLLCYLIDSAENQVTGLALPPPWSAEKTGFEFLFRKDAESRGYLQVDQGRSHYTVLNIQLDAHPVQTASPLLVAPSSAVNQQTTAP